MHSSRQINLLGTMTVEEADHPTGVMKSPKGMALLSYLIVTQQVQSREYLADLLWDAENTSKSLTNLRHLLSRMHKWLPELAIDRRTVAFRTLPDTAIDFYILDKGLLSIDVASQDKALKLYRGDLLSNFHLNNAPRFNEWLFHTREQLRLKVLDAHGRLCQTYAELQQWQKGIDVARRWLALDSLNEDAQGWLMKLLAANGQLTAVSQQYQYYRQILQAEMGVEPAQTITELWQALISGRETAVFGSRTTPVNISKSSNAQYLSLPPNSYLPYHRNQNFIGRKTQLQEIANHLLVANTCSPPVVAISGIGGIGKTQTAVEFAYRYGSKSEAKRS